MKNYLTQESLGLFLNELYPDGKWIFNKCVCKDIKSRPDYRSDVYKLIIEFNGFRHYNCTDVIVKDDIKYEKYKNLGYKVIEIPYFVQLSTSIIKLLFDKDHNYNQTYLHGFIDDKALLPCDFCSMGIDRFIKDLEKFDIIKEDIIDSLINKILKVEFQCLVLPEKLNFLIDD